MAAGTKNAPKITETKQLVEQVGENKPTEDPLAKVGKKEVTATTDTPPVPEKKPPTPQPKKPPTPQADPIADAIKREQAKKPEQKQEVRTPTPPKKPPPPTQQAQPQFDPKRVAALLDKREPQRLAATGTALENTVSMGQSGGAAELSQTEIGALRDRLAQLWSPPVGAKDPSEITVKVQFQLKPDGTLAGPPMVMTSGTSPLFMAARDSAMRAVFRGQPYNMLKPEHYEQWKYLEINFDPRDMIRG
jgi:outer membrane biosynthesis protein TonB